MRTWAPGLWARKVVGPSISAINLAGQVGSSLHDLTRRPTGWLMVAGTRKTLDTRATWRP
eukprot:5186339-Alexandrium_andersonii.AAC.1